MIYITGDTHGDFKRFQKKSPFRILCNPTPQDYVIVCGDFGLLWAKDGELRFNLEWMSRLPFTILWVQGNHENYDLIKEYPLSVWNGGKVRHIIRDKVILLERGQVFEIEGKRFFAFGGASSHDIEGGVLDRTDSLFAEKRKHCKKQGKRYRILNETWWEEELPSEEEMQEGFRNLEKVNFQVDYVITHCIANRMQKVLERYYVSNDMEKRDLPEDRLTDYFDELEDKLSFGHWYCGHYHCKVELDEKHTILYESVKEL